MEKSEWAMHPIRTREKGRAFQFFPFVFIDVEVLIGFCYLLFYGVDKRRNRKTARLNNRIQA
jgi:hypothetical protein